MLESFVTKTRNKGAALTFMKKALKRHSSPEAITTDGLRSYGAAMDELGNREKQRRTPPRRSTDLQRATLCRLGRIVAN